jgi:hypothetical protein
MGRTTVPVEEIVLGGGTSRRAVMVHDLLKTKYFR